MGKVGLDQNVIRTFSNVGLQLPQRRFPGFPDTSGVLSYVLDARSAQRVEMVAGDLLLFDLTGAGDQVKLVVYDTSGHVCPEALGLSHTEPLSLEVFDNAALVGWLLARGIDDVQIRTSTVVGGGEPVVLKANQAVSVWIIRPSGRDDLVSGTGVGTTVVRHQPIASGTLLPPPLGEVREEFTVTRGTARAYEVQKGEVIQIIDVEGQQCSDFQAFRSSALEKGLERFIDVTATRSLVRRAFPTPGLFDKFFDRDMAPMLSVLQDTCGRHDTFGLACTSRGYEERGFPGHVNCSDNISVAVAGMGVARRDAWPAINFFWNTWVDPHHHQLLTEESYSRPGDYVALLALDDLVCVSTACPDDIDPINGWNPTDVHVRIYRPEPVIRRAVAYRPKEDAPMLVSKESAFHARTAPLTNDFAPARDLWTPVCFTSVGTVSEYWACREHVALQDMSGLRKYDIVGPDAERLLQMAMTRDVARLPVWRGTYALMCDQAGEVIDDGTLFRLGPQLFRWCCGTEECGRWLDKLAADHDFQVRIHDMRNALPNLALQGPKSRDLLRRVLFTQPHVPQLDQIKWFGATVARLRDRDGAPFLLTRTGYTGELGYEIFCAEADALAIWDALHQAGDDLIPTPMGSAALETLRIEAGLAAANAEFAPGVDAHEAGLGFAVDMRKDAFVGREALERNADPRRKLMGLKFAGDDVPRHGAPVFDGERQVGVVTSATRSPMLECAIAMARIGVAHAEPGTELMVGQMDGRMKRLPATVCTIPFVDPKRERARA